MKPAQLLITHGTSDLQLLLIDETNRPVRGVPDKKYVRQLHAWLLQQDVEIVACTPERLKQPEAEISDRNGNSFALWIDRKSPEATLERSAAGKIQICFPKIEPNLTRWIDAYRSEQSLTPSLPACAVDNALILSTDRGEDQEPIANFRFLKTGLETLGVRTESIHEGIYLHPGERLESGEAAIATHIAERIEKLVREFYQINGRAPLLLSTVGGIPAVKSLVQEIANLLAGKHAMQLTRTERGALSIDTQNITDSVRTRARALEQVRRGAFLDAFAIASTYREDIDSRRWVITLERAAALLNGNPIKENGERLYALDNVLQHTKETQCLLVAIRVESALLSERWLDAINGTATFLEAAFRDVIARWFRENHINYDKTKRKITFKQNPPKILIEKKAIELWAGEKLGSHVYRANFVGEEPLKAWDQVLSNPSLSELREAIYTRNNLTNNQSYRLVEYRNYNTHGVLSQEEIDQAIKRFMGSNIWSQGVNNPTAKPKPGLCFIGQKPISEVIQSLIGQEPTPLALYQSLIGELESRLIDPASA